MYCNKRFRRKKQSNTLNPHKMPDGKTVAGVSAVVLTKPNVNGFSFGFYRKLSHSNGAFRRYV